MSDLTPRLGLAKPLDDDEDWGDDYRAAMDTLDEHPGALVATSDLQRPVVPFDGQLISRPDLGAVEQYRAASSSWGAIAGGSAVAERDGLAVHGQVDGVAPTASAVVATFAAPMNYRLFGFSATGAGDGYFSLAVGGEVLLSGRTHVLEQTVTVLLPTGVPVDAGVVVEVSVTNVAEATTSYEATTVGEH